MMDTLTPPDLWLPSRPAIIRAASMRDVEAQFPFPTFMPAKGFPFPRGALAFRSILASGNTSVNLAPSVAGDLVFVLVQAIRSGGAVTVNTPAGFTQLYQTSGASIRASAVFYKVSSGSEPSTITISFSGTAATEHDWFSFSIANSLGSPEAGTLATGTGTSVTPPSLSPSWGNKRTLWICQVANNAAPGDYTNANYNLSSNSGSSMRSNVAWRQNAVATESPGAFSFSGSSSAWAAQTIAIRGK